VGLLLGVTYSGKMKLGVLLTVNAVVSMAFGLAFVLVPAEVLAFYSVTLTPGTAVVARLFGSALVGYGVVAWLARTAAHSEALRAIVTGYFVGSAVGCVVALHGVLSGASNALGWSTLAIYGLFAVGFGFFHFGKAAVARA
jgi:hypothetical protein